MPILNFGSVNIDHVYSVDHFVQPGETLGSTGYRRFPGGKGANQSIALAHAGAEVLHAGCIGADGTWLRELLAGHGVDVTWLQTVETPTGHAIIQVTPDGENSIVLYGGANQSVSPADAEAVLADFGPADWLLLQNEISSVPEIMSLASERGLQIALNPAPMDDVVKSYPLKAVSMLIVNEIEGYALTAEKQPSAILDTMQERFAGAATVLTLGKQGAMYAAGSERIHVPAESVAAVDTTAAGDTFIGYFLARMADSADVESALRLACRAATICVTRPGAADSIPRLAEVE